MEIERTLEIRNSLGLHARAAARVVELGKSFTSRLYLGKSDLEVDAEGVLSILSLSCPKGTRVRARIVGDDAWAFMEALERLFENRFGENS